MNPKYTKKKKKKKSYTSKETLYQSWSVTLIPCQMKNSLQSGKTTKYFLCKSFLWFKEKKNKKHYNTNPGVYLETFDSPGQK